jgi:hypothetical protein
MAPVLKTGEMPSLVKGLEEDCSKNVVELRRGGRVVDGSGLENRHRGNPIGGSNPSLSAILRKSNEAKPFYHWIQEPELL